jgi:hypothetical protein
MDGLGQPSGNSGSTESPHCGTMDEVTRDALVLAISHYFRWGLVLRRLNNEGNSLSLTSTRHDDKGGCTRVGVPCSCFGGVGGVVRWSSGIETGSGGGGVVSSCSALGRGASGRLVEVRQWWGVAARVWLLKSRNPSMGLDYIYSSQHRIIVHTDS